MSKLFRIRKNEEGQSLVEFALIIPIFLLLLFGLIQFAVILNAQITVTAAAREGARIAVLGVSETEIKTRVKDSASTGILLNEITNDDISISTPEGTGKGKPISVEVNATVQIIVPFLNGILGGGGDFPLYSKAVMSLE
ncbi:MAG: TadE/TadG family type IV pilus assembly protein [Bacillota bacterium]